MARSSFVLARIRARGSPVSFLTERNGEKYETQAPRRGCGSGAGGAWL